MRVGIVMGSKSDLPVVSKIGGVLDELGVAWEMRILSAHRTPAQAEEWARTAQERGIGVLICCAGMAAHLGGVVAAHSALPVIGVPINASSHAPRLPCSSRGEPFQDDGVIIW